MLLQVESGYHKESTNWGCNGKLKAVYGHKRKSKRLKILISHNKALYIPFTKYHDDEDEIKEDETGHLKTTCRLLYLKTQFVPRSKHFHLGYKTDQFMLYGAYIQCGQSIQLLNVKSVGASLNQKALKGE